jgi:hypothetical protein
MKKHAEEDIKTDLKHDSMEFAANTEGDDALDTDDATFEPGDITVAELDALAQGNIEEQEMALVEAENDRTADDDVMPEENWEEDLPDQEEDEENKGYQRQ